jgi:hypothetical protein
MLKQSRLIEKFAPGMKRRNLQKVVDARRQFLANERGMPAANQYGCKSLGQMIVQLPIEGGELIHGHFSGWTCRFHSSIQERI